ncbi:MAG: hypothetical protein ABI592_14875 [Acidobacteriota bacterium]
MTRSLRGILLTAATFASVWAMAAPAAPASAAPRVYVRVAPPRPPVAVEVRPVAPSRRHVWVGGYQRWDGRSYVWVPGTWNLPPRRHAHWSAGHWRHGRSGWYWSDGRWR